jgi:hypothetical protein
VGRGESTCAETRMAFVLACAVKAKRTETEGVRFKVLGQPCVGWASFYSRAIKLIAIALGLRQRRPPQPWPFALGANSGQTPSKRAVLPS